MREFLDGLQALKRLGAFKAPHGSMMPKVTPAQWNALFYIAETKGSTVKEVAQVLGVTSSAATQLIEGLVREGHVVRTQSKEDRRRARLELSKKSRRQVVALQKSTCRALAKLFEVLSDREFAHYLQLHKKIIDRFSKRI